MQYYIVLFGIVYSINRSVSQRWCNFGIRSKHTHTYSNTHRISFRNNNTSLARLTLYIIYVCIKRRNVLCRIFNTLHCFLDFRRLFFFFDSQRMQRITDSNIFYHNAFYGMPFSRPISVYSLSALICNF